MLRKGQHAGAWFQASRAPEFALNRYRQLLEKIEGTESDKMSMGRKKGERAQKIRTPPAGGAGTAAK
ncbi:hypothetical protein ACM91X_001349 [Cronobacter dublinensis]